MTPELERYYESFIDMFMTEGWKNFMAQTQTEADRMDTVAGIKTEADLKFIQGHLRGLESILHLEDTVRRMLEEDDAAA